MRKRVLLTAALCALLFAGVAGAAVLSKTVWLKPGHCKKIHGTKVCARKVKSKTVTVSPSAIGKTFSGNGSSTLNPLTIAKNGVTVHWTASADAYGNNIFQVTGGDVLFDNGNSATSGQSFIPAGTYTFNVVASGAWTLSF